MTGNGESRRSLAPAGKHADRGRVGSGGGGRHPAAGGDDLPRGARHGITATPSPPAPSTPPMLAADYITGVVLEVNGGISIGLSTR
ncbi:hypothetical protein [Streptomyces sp. NBC_00582]|uniref:hypothetical protein n=1 Tax=Streptomyces sp. NBC_00582 TaxID=2975783 RepID=UPI002E81F857|nr:hypothetical protein [Streptomyces sp. NBC_00582]WUB67577.1 hypothetical protein OG852_47935 [Streptomyces sp. NBC_00582]